MVREVTAALGGMTTHFFQPFSTLDSYPHRKAAHFLSHAGESQQDLLPFLRSFYDPLSIFDLSNIKDRFSSRIQLCSNVRQNISDYT